MSIPRSWKKHAASCWRTRRNTLHPARTYQSRSARERSASRCRSPIRAPASPWRNARNSAAGRSEANVTAKWSPAPASASGSLPPSSRSITDRSTSKAGALDAAPRSLLSCRRRRSTRMMWVQTMSKPTNLVLLIDDEPKIRRFIRAGFELHGGFTVQEAEDAAAGLHAATFNTPDLIILDLALPDRRGTEVLDLVRSWSNVPIIVLSVEANEEEKVRLLELGADDYVVKPFGIAELIARSHAALRRYFKSADENPVVTAGPLSIDLVNRTVLLNNNQIRLTRK